MAAYLYYLHSEAFKSRYAMAAYFLRDHQTIIEIGGSLDSSTIDEFIKDESTKIITCDPLIKNEQKGRITYISDMYQNVDFSQYTDYGLCMLGVDGGTVHYDDKMQDLIERSKRAVIEISTDHGRSNEFFTDTVKGTTKNVILDISLDLRSSPMKDVTLTDEQVAKAIQAGWQAPRAPQKQARRRIIILE